MKAGVRFVSYDHFKHMLADTEVSSSLVRIIARSSCRSGEGKVSPPRSLLGAYSLIRNPLPCRNPAVLTNGWAICSRPGCGHDGGHLCCHAFRDDQVQLLLFSPHTPQLTLQLHRRTKLIDDAKSGSPKYRGLIHGTGCIVREEGIRGIYRGLFPVVRLFLPPCSSACPLPAFPSSPRIL